MLRVGSWVRHRHHPGVSQVLLAQAGKREGLDSGCPAQVGKLRHGPHGAALQNPARPWLYLQVRQDSETLLGK